MTDAITALTARDLGRYIGWIVTIPREGPVGRRDVVVDKLRGPWMFDGTERIGISDMTPNPPFRGTEYIVEIDSPVVPVRPLRPKAKRAAKTQPLSLLPEGDAS